MTNATKAAMANPSPSKANAKADAANNEAMNKRLKDIEISIKNMGEKFQSELDRMALMQPVGGSGGDEGAAGASAKIFDMTVRKIEAKHDAFSKRMSQIDIKVQNALTDI